MLEGTGAANTTQPSNARSPVQEEGPVEWIFQNGKWRPVRPGQGAQPEKPTQLPAQQEPLPPAEQAETAQEPVPAEYNWEQIASAGQQKRVIKIPVKEFLGGDPRYNIIIKPGDVISVPVDIVGEFYVLGNANNQGVINLTGRPMTLMQSMASAGGLGPLAWPENIEVRRRIAEKKEEIVLVNLKKIAGGSQPDFFIKPNDLINVGTHPAARWLAVLRNAFRATYGFGFIYDRNFADPRFCFLIRKMTHSHNPITNESETNLSAPERVLTWADLGIHAYIKICIVVGLIVWLFHTQIYSCIYLWADPSWSHGFLIPLFALYFLNQRKNELLTIETRPNYLGLVFLDYFSGLIPVKFSAIQNRLF